MDLIKPHLQFCWEMVPMVRSSHNLVARTTDVFVIADTLHPFIVELVEDSHPERKSGSKPIRRADLCPNLGLALFGSPPTLLSVSSLCFSLASCKESLVFSMQSIITVLRSFACSILL